MVISYVNAETWQFLKLAVLPLGWWLSTCFLLSVLFLVLFSFLLISSPSPSFLYLSFFPFITPPFYYSRLSRGQLDAALKHSLHGRSSENLSQDFEEFFLSSADEIADLLRQTPDVSHFKAHQLVCEMVQVRGREGRGMESEGTIGRKRRNVCVRDDQQGGWGPAVDKLSCSHL